MAAYAVQNITRAGVTPAYVAVSASDTFTPGPNVFLHVKNGGGSPDSVQVAVATGSAPLSLTLTSAAVSVTNGQERMMGPYPNQYFADPTTGAATVTHGFITSVTAGAFTLTQP